MNRGKSCVGFLFGLSLLVGMVLGYFVLTGIEDTRAGTVIPDPSPLDETTTAPRQDMILLLGVDDLQKTYPALEGAWLIEFCDDPDHNDQYLHIKIITLYPIIPEAVTSTQQSLYAQPHAPVTINPNDLWGLADQPPLSFSTDRWSQVVVMDEVTANVVISLQDMNTPRPIPTPTSSAFIKPWINPQGAHHQQEGILTTLCEHPAPLGHLSVVNEILQLEGSHIRSTLSEGGLLKMWQVVNFTQDKTVVCTRFP